MSVIREARKVVKGPPTVKILVVDTNNVLLADLEEIAKRFKNFDVKICRVTSICKAKLFLSRDSHVIFVLIGHPQGSQPGQPEELAEFIRSYNLRTFFMPNKSRYEKEEVIEKELIVLNEVYRHFQCTYENCPT